MIDEVRPFDGARELMEAVKSRGFRVVLASSGKSKHVDHFLDLIEGRSIADAWTTSDDVESSKPEPDLVATALDKVEGASGVMIGDSTWDCIAAGRLGVPSLAVRTGASRSRSSSTPAPSGCSNPCASSPRTSTTLSSPDRNG
jgi:phosphoglycolate phosphatase-like HAD superfamily hydrolase